MAPDLVVCSGSLREVIQVSLKFILYSSQTSALIAPSTKFHGRNNPRQCGIEKHQTYTPSWCLQMLLSSLKNLILMPQVASPRQNNSLRAYGVARRRRDPPNWCLRMPHSRLKNPSSRCESSIQLMIELLPRFRTAQIICREGQTLLIKP